MGFGAKTLSQLVKEVADDASMSSFDAAANASFKMNPAASLQKVSKCVGKRSMFCIFGHCLACSMSWYFSPCAEIVEN